MFFFFFQGSPGASRKQDKPLPAPPPPQRDPPPPPPPERPPPIPPESRAAWLAVPTSSSGLPRDLSLPSDAWSPKDTSHLVESRAGAERSPKLAHVAPAHLNGRPLSCSAIGYRPDTHSDCSKVRHTSSIHKYHQSPCDFGKTAVLIKTNLCFNVITK